MARRVRARCGALAAASALLFAGASLAPVRHLVDAGYAARFAAFSAALAILALLAARAAARLLRTDRALLLTGASLFLVLVPTWLWNRVGPMNVLMVHVDTLRADHCSVYGYGRRTTPNLERFARDEALLFTQFIAQSGGTDKSTPAMLASIYPSMFYDPDEDGYDFRVPGRFPMLGEYLAPAGYASAGLSANPFIGARFNYPRGFTTFEELWDEDLRPAELLARVRERLAGIDRPWFGYALVLDPHSPYEPEPEFDVFGEPGAPSHAEIGRRVVEGEPLARFADAATALYDGEILEVDAALGELFDWLEGTGRLEHTMVIVTSDHGEKFLEHGEWGHGGTLYEPLIHVPLVWSFPSPLRFPRLAPARDVVDSMASHVDLVPTILGWLGVDAPGSAIQGTDLTPMLYGRAPWNPAPVLSEELTDGKIHRVLRTEDHKLFVAREDGEWRRVLVELGEAGALDDAELRRALDRELDELVESSRDHYRSKPPLAPIGPERAERLRQLGYGD